MAKKMVCGACGSIGTPVRHTSGSFLLEVVLWLCFLVPGIIYSVWRMTSRKLVCPQCGAPNMLPLDSPVGQQLAAKKG